MQQMNLMRPIRLVAIALLSTVILFLGIAIVPLPVSVGELPPDTFEEVWQTVNDNFFDPNFNGVDWQDVYDKYRPQAKQARSPADLAKLINQMLAELQTSHTHFYTPDEPEYYQIAGIFFSIDPTIQQQLETVLPDGKPQYSGIGIFTQELEGNTFIRAILDGSPASEAGLLVGDRLLSVAGEPFHPIHSFANKAERPVKLMIQRSPDSRREITVTPKIFDGTTMFLDAMEASIRVIERGGKKIGYVHIWSYAGEQIHEQLKTELFYGRLKNVDSLILDLRDGWGGASPSYLNIYTPRNITISGITRNRTPSTSNSAWSKPVVMLVNERSRSGKEILAYGFRKYGIGTVVGTKTAGAVVGGSLFAMDDGSFLYLAVMDVYLDGRRLEGVGVEPDIEVPFSLEYARGLDSQQERAIAVALKAASSK